MNGWASNGLVNYSVFLGVYAENPRLSGNEAIEGRHMLEVCLRLVSIVSKSLTISKMGDNARLQCFYHVF